MVATPTNIPEELHDLRKEVYKRTGWTPNELFAASVINHVPDYNSDYLMRKMPSSIENKEHGYLWRLNVKSMKTWFSAAYENELFVRIHLASHLRSDESLYHWGKPAVGDTPLEALLRLVIALDDAGELNHD